MQRVSCQVFFFQVKVFVTLIILITAILQFIRPMLCFTILG